MMDLIKKKNPQVLRMRKPRLTEARYLAPNYPN